MDFLLFFFVSLIALGTSSLRLVVSPWGVGYTAPPFRGEVSKGSKLYNWWFGKASGLIDTNWWICYFEETVDDGLGGRCLDVGRCPVAPPPWLVMAGRSGRYCQLLCFFFCFFYLLKIHGDCWQGAGMEKKVLAQLLLGWEVNSTVLSETLFLLRHRSNCGDYWCSHVVRKGGRQVQKYSWIVGWGWLKFPCVLMGWRMGRNVRKLSNVGGEWKSPPEIVG